ncbi:contactin-6-like, partial [Hyposmocoma kahamanoa]|uniref:contactin-6-like n=2 Tax=Hyposmocoma kahamanoa TaxID=1477025 RepID=UPI000E6D880B
LGQAFQPEFAEPLTNLTVAIGRDATFRCLVQNLGGYRVGWVKADTKAIQAIHVHVITNNHRVGVSHNGQTVWNLHIRNVQEEDRGQYMCQINTDPMKSQMGFLEVVIPPDFIPEETSGDVMIPEGGTARVSCKAKGMPKPRIMWRREDGGDIILRNAHGDKNKVAVYEDEVLTLTKISRSDMGAYLCIASNGVPPSVSKRIMIKVHFHPVIQVPNQLVGAPLGTDVSLECYVESSPKSINYWVRDSNEMVISSNKYEVLNAAISSFESRMVLTVRRLTAADVGGYRCVAKNSLGEVDSIIRLYEIPGPTVRNTSPASKSDKYTTATEEQDNQFGSADNSDDEDEMETVTDVPERTPNVPTVRDEFIKNKTINITTNFVNKDKLSNKVRKIINKFELDEYKLANSNRSNKLYSRIVYKRYIFCKAEQRPGEGLTDWAARVRSLAQYCGFRNDLETALRDRFVLGLENAKEKEKLFAEDVDTLTFDKAVELAQNGRCARLALQVTRSEHDTVAAAAVQPVFALRRGSTGADQLLKYKDTDASSVSDDISAYGDYPKQGQMLETEMQLGQRKPLDDPVVIVKKNEEGEEGSDLSFESTKSTSNSPLEILDEEGRVESENDRNNEHRLEVATALFVNTP